MKIRHKNGLTYLIHKKTAWAIIEWPVFIFFIRRYVIFVRLNNWVLWASGKGHNMIDWDHYVYGKWWYALCFHVQKTEQPPPTGIWNFETGPWITSDKNFIRVDENPKP